MVVAFFLDPDPGSWPTWLTAIGTCFIAAFAVVALLNLWDARRTRHSQILTDLSRRWDEPLAVRSREIAGEYDSAALVDLADRVYNPRSWTSTEERREETDTLIRLLGALNLMETIGALWIGRALSAKVIQRMYPESPCPSSRSLTAHSHHCWLSDTTVMIRGRGDSGILYWLWRGGPPNAPIGPAWVIEADGTGRPINGNDPISRTEAARLAEVGDYIFDAEDVEAGRSISN